jgi:hypothetical protein
MAADAYATGKRAEAMGAQRQRKQSAQRTRAEFVWESGTEAASAAHEKSKVTETSSKAAERVAAVKSGGAVAMPHKAASPTGAVKKGREVTRRRVQIGVAAAVIVLGATTWAIESLGGGADVAGTANYPQAVPAAATSSRDAAALAAATSASAPESSSLGAVTPSAAKTAKSAATASSAPTAAATTAAVAADPGPASVPTTAASTTSGGSAASPNAVTATTAATTQAAQAAATTTSAAPSACSTTWATGRAYVRGDEVAYDGRLWEANQWNYNEVPGGAAGAWDSIGSC